MENLLAKLQELRELDPQLQLFGAAQHRYQLETPLTEAEIARFEADERVQLPAEYRQFLAAAGNGGAGPVYGLKPLARWRPESFVRESDPSLPFPLAAEWGPPAEDHSNFPEGASLYDGCLELAEIGCGYFYFLVLNGPHAGEVWQDYTAGDGKISPTGKSFFGWYDEWLDESLAERGYEWIAQALRSGERSELLQRQLPRIEKHAGAFPEWATGHLRMAMVHGYRGEFARAEAELARALELEARMALEVMRARAVLLWRQDRLADLVELATQVIGGQEFHFTILKELHQVRFIALLRLGRKPEAIAAAAARVELDEHDLSAWLDYAQLQDRLSAEKTIQRAAEANAGKGELATQGFGALAQRLAADGRTDDAAYFSALAARN